MDNEKLVDLMSMPVEEFCEQASHEEMEAIFGDDAEMVEAYATTPKPEKAGGDSLVIFVPGLTGSVLENAGGSRKEVVWLNPFALLQGRMNHLDLADDGVTDATEGVTIEAPRPLWVAYAKIILRLQHEFSAPVFAYDWRKATTHNARLLRDFINEQLPASGFERVVLVGHSMGGLVITDYLTMPETKAEAEQKVRTVVTLGTPYRGAMEAVLAFANPDDPKFSVLAKVNKNNDAHRMVLTWPGMYHLLPAPNNLYPGWSPLPDLDIYDPAVWRDHNIAIKENHLAAAKAHHQMLAAADPQVPYHLVAGTYYDTPISIMGTMLSGEPKINRDENGGGDGTVEVSSAIFNDRGCYYLQELHVELVLDQDVIDTVVDWCRGGSPSLLANEIAAVVQNDLPLRGSASDPRAVSPDQIAQKLNSNQGLTAREMKAMMGFSSMGMSTTRR